jgi:hypothetical protein
MRVVAAVAGLVASVVSPVAAHAGPAVVVKKFVVKPVVLKPGNSNVVRGAAVVGGSPDSVGLFYRFSKRAPAGVSDVECEDVFGGEKYSGFCRIDRRWLPGPLVVELTLVKDGQEVTVRRTVSVRRDTKFTGLSVRAGRLAGRFLRFDGRNAYTAASGAKLRVYFKAKGKHSWVPVRAVKTRRDGRFQTTVKGRGQWKVVFVGSSWYDAQTSTIR